MLARTALRIAVIGAGPVGLALALLAERRLPQAELTVFDARPADHDVAADPRTLALALGSVQLLRRLQAWPAARAEPILAVHVSQAPPSLPGAEVLIRADELAAPMLGAVLAYGAIVAPMQQAWAARVHAGGGRHALRLGTPVAAVKPLAGGVEVDAGVAETYDLVVIAEGGIFGEQERKALVRDYRQAAWVGSVTLEGARPGWAFERFTAQGPAALLPLPPAPDGRPRASLVWCQGADDDAVQALDARQRLALLNTLFPAEAGRVVELSELKRFPLGLNAERSLVDGRVVRIGNAAQTLHPVAGQGLNLGLRDAYALVDALRDAPNLEAALRRVAWARAPDRWSMIAATDLLARGFTWRAPGLAALRGLALAGLQHAGPLKRQLARQMMFGWR